MRTTRAAVPRLVLAGALSALTSLSAVALMGASAWLIARAAQHPQAATLTLAAVGVRTLALARALLRYGERLVGHDAVLRVVADLRVRVFDALRARTRNDAASEVGVVVSDVEAVQDLWLRAVLPYASALVVAAVTAVALWPALPEASVVLAVVQLAGLVVVPLVAWSAAAREERLAHWRGEQQAAVVDLLHGAAELLVLGGTERALARSELAGEQVWQLERAASRRTGLLAALLVALQGGATLGVAVLGAGAVVRGDLGPVALAVVVLVTLASFEPLVAVVDGSGVLRQSAGSLRRVRALLSSEVLPLGVLERVGPIEVSGVEHRYDDRAAPSLRLPGLRLRLETGSSLGVVGGSGAGKSTLLRLLGGELRPTAGMVTAAGVPMADLTSEERARVVASAEQDAHVFDATVADNLRVGRPDATEQELRGVLDVVGLGAWLAALVDGLDTALGHRGTRMSGGERKRLCVARALLAPAPVLLLDEPTEGLEPDAADALLRAVLAAATDRAVVVVTHRVVALDAVDEVLVLDHGSLVDRGPADELRRTTGLFQDAWQLQARDVQEVAA